MWLFLRIRRRFRDFDKALKDCRGVVQDLLGTVERSCTTLYTTTDKIETYIRSPEFCFDTVVRGMRTIDEKQEAWRNLDVGK